ncbi:2052_t:CDS:1, partial [Dentiscutata heterogama]
QGVIVTNLGYSKKARNIAKKNKILLTQKSDIEHKLVFYIKKVIEEKELDILENIEKEKNICLYIE